jgi:hypothetical protein
MQSVQVGQFAKGIGLLKTVAAFLLKLKAHIKIQIFPFKPVKYNQSFA